MRRWQAGDREILAVLDAGYDAPRIAHLLEWLPVAVFASSSPATGGEPDAETVQVTDRHGAARTVAWDHIRPRLTTRSAWIDHTGDPLLPKGR